MAMHSWVFRNRARLRQIYGSPPSAGDSRATPPGRPADVPEGAGRVVRRTRYVLLRPMPRERRPA